MRSIAARLLALPPRLLALPPRLQDLVLAIALTIVNVATLVPYRGQLHPLWAAVLLVMAQSILLIWRRSWPVAVFMIIGLARVTYDQARLGYAPVPLGPAIAYYTVMDLCSTRVRWGISAIVLAGTLSSQAVPGHSEPYDFFVAALIMGAAGMAGLLSRTRRAYVAEVESRARRAESERDREVALAAAVERTRIARELHDVVAHHVSLMAVQAEAASSLLPDRPAEAQHSVEIISGTARQALAELRRLLGVLRMPADQPTTAPLPSLAGLDVVLDQVRAAGLPVDVRVEGRPCTLAPGIDLTAYRIVQEALTNTIRHAPAARAAVTLSYEPGFLTVSVADSGPVVRRPAGVTAGRVSVARPGGTEVANGAVGDGAVPDGAVPDGAAGPRETGTRSAVPGFGLAGIAERVASCGGSLSVGPTTAGGFALTAKLPSL